jgi:hypothetical protein
MAALHYKSFLPKFIYSIFLLAFCLVTNAQISKKISGPKPFKPSAKEFVISYAIVVKGEKIGGIAETYNGGLKTAFVKNDVVRLRLVSLMRTQSVFFNNKKGLTKKVATVVKESGKEKAKMFLNAKQWKVFNAKNDSLQCEIFKDDTIRVLDLLCAKAIITTKDSSKLTVYFFPCVKNKTLAAVEPLFACVPGLVMKYTYTKDDKAIEYTATSLKAGRILPSTFTIPIGGYMIQKYNPGGASILAGDLNAEDEEEGTEEEETEMTEPGAAPINSTPPAGTTTTPAPPVPDKKPPRNL